MECGRDAFYMEAGVCRACYQALYYWGDKTPTQVLKRQKNLALYQRRMETLTNVRPMSKSRRA